MQKWFVCKNTWKTQQTGEQISQYILQQRRVYSSFCKKIRNYAIFWHFLTGRSFQQQTHDDKFVELCVRVAEGWRDYTVRMSFSVTLILSGFIMNICRHTGITIAFLRNLKKKYLTEIDFLVSTLYNFCTETLAQLSDWSEYTYKNNNLSLH